MLITFNTLTERHIESVNYLHVFAVIFILMAFLLIYEVNKINRHIKLYEKKLMEAEKVYYELDEEDYTFDGFSKGVNVRKINEVYIK